MSREIKITTPLTKNTIERLVAGDFVSITGKLYTARDAAHAKLIEMLDKGKKLPFDIEDQIIYYTGPCPPKPGDIIGSSGPTTSGRMDAYTPRLLENGLKGMIGKGERNKAVIDSIKKNKAVYFAAVGGLGALLSKRVKKIKEIAFEELGTESIKELWVEDFPCIVAIDVQGNDLYKTERTKYERRNQNE